MARSSQAGLVVAAVLCAAWPTASAAAAPRLAIAPVKDDAAGLVGPQLQQALCAARECLAGALAGPKLDLARARRLGADGQLVASVWKEQKGSVLSVALFTTSAKPARSWKLPLGADGRLPRPALDTLAAGVAEVLPLPAKAVTAPPAPPPAPRPSPPAAEREKVSQAQAPAPAPARAPAPTPAAARAPTPAPTPAQIPAPTAAPARAPTPTSTAAPRLILEVGLSPTHRELRFSPSGADPAPLGLRSDQPALPRLRVEWRLL